MFLLSAVSTSRSDGWLLYGVCTGIRIPARHSAHTASSFKDVGDMLYSAVSRRVFCGRLAQKNDPMPKVNMIAAELARAINFSVLRMSCHTSKACGYEEVRHCGLVYVVRQLAKHEDLAQLTV